MQGPILKIVHFEKLSFYSMILIILNYSDWILVTFKETSAHQLKPFEL